MTKQQRSTQACAPRWTEIAVQGTTVLTIENWPPEPRAPYTSLRKIADADAAYVAEEDTGASAPVRHAATGAA